MRNPSLLSSASALAGCVCGTASIDGVLVLFHDNELMRIAGRPEAIHDLTYAELLQIDFGLPTGERFKGERIPTLEEFLRHFGGKDLHFAIEIKEHGVEEETLRLIHQYCRQDHVIITTAIWDAITAVRALDPDMRVGYLCKYLSDSLVESAKQAGVRSTAKGKNEESPGRSLLQTERFKFFPATGAQNVSAAFQFY